VDERLTQLFDRLIAGGLSDVAGAEASVTLPISRRLLNEALAATLPSSAAVRELDVTPLDGDRFLVSGRIGSSPLLPPFQLNVAIDRQAEFPSSPVLVLRLESMGLRLLAGLVLRRIPMPAWIRIEFDRIHVDLRALADQHGVGEYFRYIDQLQVKTLSGTLLLSLRARVR
jgi:hypothetical protein